MDVVTFPAGVCLAMPEVPRQEIKWSCRRGDDVMSQAANLTVKNFCFLLGKLIISQYAFFSKSGQPLKLGDSAVASSGGSNIGATLFVYEVGNNSCQFGSFSGEHFF